MYVKTNKMKRLIVLLLVITFVFTACGPAGGGGGAASPGDEPITLRLASDAPMDHMASRLNLMAVERVYERTNGRVIIEYFPAGQLGGYLTVYDELIMGTIDIAQIPMPDALDARLGVGYLPYYATNFEEAATLFGPQSFLTQYFGEITAQHNVLFIGWLLEGFNAMGVVGDFDIDHTPGAAKPGGFRMRSAPMATFRFVQEDLGYNIVVVPYGEVPIALSTGVIDAWIGPPSINYAWGLGDLLDRMYINYIQAEATSIVMSEASLARLSEADQRIVIEVFQEISAYSFIEAQAEEEKALAGLAAAGVEIVRFTPAQLAEHAAFVRENTWPRLEEEFTSEFMNSLRAEVAQFS